MNENAMKYQILVGGKTLSGGTIANIKRITFEAKFFETSRVEIEFENGIHFDLSIQEVKLETPIIVKFGYFGGSLREVFDGTVARIDPNFQKGQGADSLILTALDRSDDMKILKGPSIHAETSPYDIAVKIIERHNMNAVISPAGVLRSLKHKRGQGMTQKNMTDWGFLTHIAKKVNFKLFCQGQTVYLVGNEYLDGMNYDKVTLIHNPDVDELRSPNTYELTHFNPNIDKSRQRTKAVVRSWSAYNSEGQEIGKKNLEQIPEGTEGFTEIRVEERQERIFTVYEIARSLQQAQILAEKELDRRAEELVIGNCRSKGCPQVMIGQKVNIVCHSFGDFGTAHSGDYLVKAVRHQASMDGFDTKIDIAKRTIEI